MLLPFLDFPLHTRIILHLILQNYSYFSGWRKNYLFLVVVVEEVQLVEHFLLLNLRILLVVDVLVRAKGFVIH